MNRYSIPLNLGENKLSDDKLLFIFGWVCYLVLNSDILLFDDLIGLLNRILGRERKTKDFDFLPIIEVIKLKRVVMLFYLKLDI